MSFDLWLSPNWCVPFGIFAVILCNFLIYSYILKFLTISNRWRYQFLNGDAVFFLWDRNQIFMLWDAFEAQSDPSACVELFPILALFNNVFFSGNDLPEGQLLQFWRQRWRRQLFAFWVSPVSCLFLFCDQYGVTLINYRSLYILFCVKKLLEFVDIWGGIQNWRGLLVQLFSRPFLERICVAKGP